MSCSGGITAISNCLLFNACVMKLRFFSDAAAPLSVSQHWKPFSSCTHPSASQVVSMEDCWNPTSRALTSFFTDSNSETQPNVDHFLIHQSLSLEEPAPALRNSKNCS